MSVYGAFNTFQFNTVLLDGPNLIIFVEPEVCTEIEQTVSKTVSDNILTLSQSVELQNIASGTVMSVSQTVNAMVDSTICEISQSVLASAPDSFFTKYGWEVDIIINNVLIPKDHLFNQELTITKDEDQSTLCEFTILGDYLSVPMSEFIEAVDGKRIVINYYNTTGAYRLFSGMVDIPDIDLINKRLRFRCTNKRDELIKATMGASQATLGRYCPEIQGDYKDLVELVNYRMSTVTASLDFDSYNRPNYNSWFAKSTPDFTLNPADIYYREPQVTWQSRGRVLNDVSVNIAYTFTRLYHKEQSFTWTHPNKNSFCTQRNTAYSTPNVQMILDAIQGARWKVVGEITFDHLWPANESGIYQDCGETVFVPAPQTTPYNYKLDLDEDNQGKVDTGGMPLYKLVPVTPYGRNLSETFTLGAHWTASTQWSQNIKENYYLNIRAPQSISKYGSVTKTRNITINDPYDSTVWENYTTVLPTPGNAVSQSGSYFANVDQVNRLYNAILTSIDIARAEILDSHRQTVVTVETALKPHYELRHTVKVDTDTVTCKGRLTRIKHTLDFSNRKNNRTELSFGLFKSTGSQSDTARNPPSRPGDSVQIAASAIGLQSHFGMDPDTTSGAAGWNGYIGNGLLQNRFWAAYAFGGPAIVYSNVREEFRVDVPPIPDVLRSLRILSAVPTTYNISIPNDLLEF
jgi:hypothetical protein